MPGTHRALEHASGAPPAPEAAEPGVELLADRAAPWAWVPLPLLLVAMIGLWLADLREPHESARLLAFLNFGFLTAVSLYIAFLAGATFLASGAHALLALGAGVLLMGTGSLAAALAGAYGPNVIATVHNVAMLAAGALQLAAALLLLRPPRPARAPVVVLGLVYPSAVTLALLVTSLAVSGLTPAFFVPGRGGTPLRQGVLLSAAALFAISGLLLARSGARSTFHRWYALGLGLIGLGLVAVLVEPALGTPLGWLGRAAQYLGSLYTLVAALTHAARAQRWRLPLEVALQDVEERYRIRRESGERAESVARELDVLLNTAQVGIVKVADRRQLWMNRKTEELLGWGRGELVGQPTRILFPDEEQYERSGREAYAALRDGRAFEVEQEFVRKDGTRLWARCRGMALEPREPAKGSLWVIEDITEQRRARERLAESEARLQSIFATMAEGVVLQDGAGRVVSCNAAAERILGVPAGKLTGRSSVDPRWRMIHEDGSALPYEEHPGMIALRTGRAQTAAIMGVEPPGAPLRWLSVSSQPLGPPAGGVVSGVVSTFTEITELRRGREALRESGRRLSDVLDGSDDGYFEVLPATREAMHSARMTAIVGETPESLPTMDAWEERIHPEDRGRVHTTVGALVDGTAPRADVQYRIRARSGEWRWVRVRAKAAREGAGSPVRIAGTVRDITATRLAQEQLQRTIEENEKLVAELREALTHVKTLSGLVPICAYCKKIRDDEGYWERIESYLESRTDAEFSHGMCPSCIEKHFGSEE